MLYIVLVYFVTDEMQSKRFRFVCSTVKLQQEIKSQTEARF